MSTRMQMLLMTLLVAVSSLVDVAQAQNSESREIARELLSSVSARVGAQRAQRLIVEYGSACESALRGPVACATGASVRAIGLVGELDATVSRRSLALARADAEGGAMIKELPPACRSASESADLLLIDEISGPAERPVIVYRTLTMEPGSNCRIGGGGKVRLELIRKGDKFEKLSERVLEYY